MIAKLLGRTKRSRKIDQATIPDGQRIYAIGDVHGRNDKLHALLKKIDKDDFDRGAADTKVIFLGDLVDRGPESKQVLDTTLALSKSNDNIRFLMGNHEEVMLSAATGDEKSVRFFYKIGGKETILSYDISKTEFQSLSMEQLAERLPSLIPQEHITFMQSFEDMIIIGDYAFVHAGIRPEIALDEQKPKDLRWIRERFIHHDGDHEKIIVYGHTISKTEVEDRSRIGIDTGAYESGVLTALCLEGNERWYLNTKADD